MTNQIDPDELLHETFKSLPWSPPEIFLSEFLEKSGFYITEDKFRKTYYLQKDTVYLVFEVKNARKRIQGSPDGVILTEIVKGHYRLAFCKFDFRDSTNWYESWGKRCGTKIRIIGKLHTSGLFISNQTCIHSQIPSLD